jgi:hypothetical protein
MEMRRFVLVLFSTVVALNATAFQADASRQGAGSTQAASIVGRWRVKFTLSGVGEKNLVFEAQAKGSGSFLLLDTGPENKPAPDSLPAAWSITTNDRVNFSGEAELPIGHCCRETGTLIFKGKFKQGNLIQGKTLFVGTTEDEENLNGYRSLVGTFTATLVTGN